MEAAVSGNACAGMTRTFHVPQFVARKSVRVILKLEEKGFDLVEESTRTAI
jgi:hypothetical protein